PECAARSRYSTHPAADLGYRRSFCTGQSTYDARHGPRQEHGELSAFAFAETPEYVTSLIVRRDETHLCASGHLGKPEPVSHARRSSMRNCRYLRFVAAWTARPRGDLAYSLRLATFSGRSDQLRFHARYC